MVGVTNNNNFMAVTREPLKLAPTSKKKKKVLLYIVSQNNRDLLFSKNLAIVLLLGHCANIKEGNPEVGRYFFFMGSREQRHLGIQLLKHIHGYFSLVNH